MTADLPGANTRAVEEGIVRDFRTNLSYSAYLHLDELLAAQQPRSAPVHHDELLFIVQHQTSELWLKLLLHELRSACDDLAADMLAPALKKLARIKHIQKTLIEQWSVLATLTPAEYAEFRGALGSSSGFQSAQYRAVEFLLGNKNAAILRLFEHDERALAELTELLERDVRRAHVFCPELVDVLTHIYDDTEHYWDVYETCEELVDIEENFQLWRFRHLKTVQRMIGGKTGTGGSSGVPFLRRALELTFFPELYAVRSTIGA